MKYRRVRYRYTLLAPERLEIPRKICDAIYVHGHMVSSFLLTIRSLEVEDSCLLLIKEDYSWNGFSGSVLDSENTMRADLLRDALYQLMRVGCLDRKYRGRVDRLYLRNLWEDGVPFLRRWAWYLEARIFGKKLVDPRTR